jgi:hypothetical protein
MTRDEILNMPAGREMDALVAEKVFGRKTAWFSGPGGPVITGGTMAKVSTWTPIKPYSTDIAAAWEVVEKMISNGWRFYLRAVGTYFEVEFQKGGSDGIHTGYIDAETFPLAVGRAAILLEMMRAN